MASWAIIEKMVSHATATPQGIIIKLEIRFIFLDAIFYNNIIPYGILLLFLNVIFYNNAVHSEFFNPVRGGIII